MEEMHLRPLNGSDFLGRLTPGSTVYTKEGPVVVKSLHWFGVFDEMNVIEDMDGTIHPANTLMVVA